MKFLVDMPLSPALAAWLRDAGYDAIHAGELGLERATDEELTALAKAQARTIVTADLDYPRLLAIARATDPSVILFRDGNWSDAEVVARLREVLGAMDVADIEHSIIVVQPDSIRRRRLPIGRG